MRKLFPLFAVAAMITGLSFAARAADDKEVTVTGDGVCAKCALGEQKTCQNVIITKEGDKEVKYYLTGNDVAKAYHKSSGICAAKTDSPVKTKATGTVKEEEGKKVLTASKIEKAE